MIITRWLFPTVSGAVARWQESGENPAIFCYLIVWGTCTLLRSRILAPIPNFARHETVCSNRSFTFSARSTIPTGSEN